MAMRYTLESSCFVFLFTLIFFLFNLIKNTLVTKSLLRKTLVIKCYPNGIADILLLQQASGLDKNNPAVVRLLQV